MDVKLSPQGTNKHSKSIITALIIITVVSVSFWSFSQPSGSQKVSRSQIWTDTVKRGDLAIQVEGFGKLKSKVQRLLSAPDNAIVEEIILKPGALVTKDSIIARLSNPQIAQQVKDANRVLANTKTSYLQLELNQKREILSQQAQQEQLLSELEIAELKVTAEQKLVTQGIVSELTFKRSQLDYRQLSRRIVIEKSRLKQLSEVHQKELDIAQDKIAQQAEQVAVIKERFNKLTVKAGISGVVQALPVELGQSVTLGEQIALVGSLDSLYAMINVSQSDMEQVAIKQIVSIDTRAGSVSGVVSRINPVVNQGMIAIEVSITGELPNNARPELNVDAIIAIGMLTNTTYIKKPVNVTAGMKTRLFRLLPNTSEAEQINISFGQESDEFIEVVSNVKTTDTFILSDMSRWQDTKEITITD
ncbi:MAG: HlyD family secretion protein [Alteromonadaceae bacterium]|jgi:HlyD family secretion protein